MSARLEDNTAFTRLIVTKCGETRVLHRIICRKPLPASSKLYGETAQAVTDRSARGNADLDKGL